MKKFYHGTTYEAMKEIINGNYAPDRTIWDCSDDAKLYAWDRDWSAGLEYWDIDCTPGQIDTNCAFRANENGQITNALKKEPDKFTYVVEFSMEDELYEEMKGDERIEADESSPNMDGAVQIEAFALNKYIKEGKVNIRIFQFTFCRKLALFYLVNLIDNDYFTEALERLEDDEHQVLMAMGKADIGSIWETLYDNTKLTRIFYPWEIV